MHGAIYDGEWKNNYQNGKGIHKYENGDVYDGNFLEGQKSGYGEYTY